MTVHSLPALLQARLLASATFALAVLLACAGCDSEGATPEPQTFRYDFEEGPQSWETIFSAYPAGREDFYELESGHRRLPAPLDTTAKALYLSGDNHSDALKMLLKREVEGLQPGATYEVSFEISLATNAPSGCVGAGGAPGEGVIVAALASRFEPVTALNEFGDREINEDLLRRAGSTLNQAKIGDVANGLKCTEALRQGLPYRMKQVECKGAEEHWTMIADEEGRAWLLVGTRSGFESITSLYYDEIVAVFEPA
jgi:hypothetical protein